MTKEEIKNYISANAEIGVKLAFDSAADGLRMAHKNGPLGPKDALDADGHRRANALFASDRDLFLSGWYGSNLRSIWTRAVWTRAEQGLDNSRYVAINQLKRAGEAAISVAIMPEIKLLLEDIQKRTGA